LRRGIGARRRAVAVGICGVALVLAAVLAGPAKAQETPRLFGTTEIRSNNIRPFPKWTDMLARHHAEERRGDPACTPTRIVRCSIADWLAFLETLRNQDRTTQMTEVNSFLNRHPYVLDKLNYWETPREFAVFDGDCKDYAIAKYFSLRYLGWSEDELRVVVVQDLNLRVAHAVLAVYTDGTILILDNQVRQVVRADSIRHYLPYYSINESSWWLHKSDPTLPRPTLSDTTTSAPVRQ
jgi:predicted transglutaminase-like cysteine proteinase